MTARKRTASKSKTYLKDNWLLIFLLAIHLIISLLLFSPQLFTGGDNVMYLILAESLVSGKGYRDVHLPEEPPHTKFPVGFPLLLSIPKFIFSESVIAPKLLVLLTSLLAFVLIYRVYELVFRTRVTMLAIFYLFIPLFYIYNHFVLSEIPYLCCSFAALYLFLKARKGRHSLFYLSFVLAVFSFLIRSAGIALIVAMMIVLLIEKRFTYFVILLVVFLAAFIPWQIRSAGIPEASTYFDEILMRDPYDVQLGKIGVIDYATRILNNFVTYSFTISPQAFLPLIRSRPLLVVVGVFLLVFMVLGFVKPIRKFTVIEYYFIISVLIMFSWPRIWSASRFMLPLMPIIIIYFFCGLSLVARRVRVKYLAEVIVVAVIALNIVKIFPGAKQAMRFNVAYFSGDKYAGYTPQWRSYLKVIEWIPSHIPDDKIIAARKPQFVYLLSKHKSRRCPFFENEEEVLSAFQRSDYIILDKFRMDTNMKHFLRSVFEERREMFEVVYKTSEPVCYLIRVKK